MEISVTRQTVTVHETVQDEFDERPIDTSFVLPDYCPDIAAVLKCTVKPALLARQQSGDRLVADGISTVQVLYLDDERRCVRSCEFAVPFTGSFTLKHPGAESDTLLSVRPDYINCRAVSPRRLDVHGAVTVHLVRTKEEKREVIGAFPDTTVFCKTETLCGTVLTASAEKNFTVSEVLEVGENRAPVQALLRSEAMVATEECRVISGKVILKGELRTRNLYVTNTETGDTECVRHAIPFQQVLDVPQASEELLWDVSVEPTVCESTVTPNQNGEGTLIGITAKLQAFVRGYLTEECSAVTDAYSTECPLAMEKQPIEVRRLLSVSETVCTVNVSTELPSEGIRRIHDVRCEVTPTGVRTEGECTYVDGHATVCLLACDADGAMGYFERTVDVSLPFDEVCDHTDAVVCACDTEYRQNGDRLELKLRITVKRRCYQIGRCLCVTEAALDESAAYAKQKAAVKIYYADKGERLWDIARRCRTGVERICAENGITGEELLQDTMLLIPYGG